MDEEYYAEAERGTRSITSTSTIWTILTIAQTLILCDTNMASQPISEAGAKLNLLFIRHGETQDNIDRILQGHRDTSLTTKGLEEAKVLAQNLESDKIDIIYNDIPDDHTPLGAHGVGEIGITGVGAAIANAVFNATGKRIRELPITLDKLM